MFGRSRWAAVGAIVAVLVGGGSVLTASAAGSPSASSFVPITPCRLFDTRAGADNIGPRSAPLGPNETHIAQVWGSNGNCTIPTGATGVSLGVTIVNPTSPSFLTVFPADATRPLASNLNWVAGQAPTPNAVTAPLSADGRMGLYNLAGTVDVLVDIVGYYELATSGPTGPPGPKGDPGLSGPKGDTGDPGPRPAQVVWVAKSGGDFANVNAALASITDNGSSQPYVIRIAPGVYTEPGGLDLKDYVDIEGSGQDITTITCACGSTTDPGTNGSSATLRASGPSLHSEVRDLTISNTGGNTHSTGVRTSQVLDQVALRNLTITASGAASSWGVVTVVSSSPIIADVTAAATGSNSASGVVNLDSSPTMTDVTAAGTAAGARGVWNLTDASPTMTDVIATATSTVGLASAVQNEAGASPTMTDVIATATSDSSVARGVFNIASSPTMTGGSATGGGASAGIGIHNSNGGSPTFNTVTATGTGSGPVRGMVNESSASATLVNVTARGSGSLNQDVGIENLTNATMTVRDSFVTGTQISILNNGSTVRVANTRLSTVTQGAMTCINSYLSDTFALLNASCQ